MSKCSGPKPSSLHAVLNQLHQERASINSSVKPGTKKNYGKKAGKLDKAEKGDQKENVNYEPNSKEKNTDWSISEEKLLKKGMASVSVLSDSYWPDVAAIVRTRTAEECEKKFEIEEAKLIQNQQFKEVKETAKSMAIPSKGPTRKWKLAKALHRSAFDKDKLSRGGVLKRWEESRNHQKKIQKTRKPVEQKADNGEESEEEIEKEIERSEGGTTEHMSPNEYEVFLIESSSEGGITPGGSTNEDWESARSSESSVVYMNEITPVYRSPSCIVLTDNRSFTKSPMSVENSSPPALPKSFAETFPAKLIRKSSDRRLSGSGIPLRSPHHQMTASQHESQSDGTATPRSDICLTPLREELLFDFHTGLTPSRGETPQQEDEAPKQDDECSVTDDLWSGIDKPKTYQQYMWVSKIAGKKKKVTKKMRKANQRKSMGVTEEMNRVLSMHDKQQKKNVKREDQDQFAEECCEESDGSSSQDSDEN